MLATKRIVPAATSALSSSMATLTTTTGTAQHVHPNELRTRFSKKLSDMYANEVPLYADLLALVRDTNVDALAKYPPALRKRFEDEGESQRLAVERHGAIRVGTPEELGVLARVFKLLGLRGVGYYDLYAAAGLPIHATAFRAVDIASLTVNPFRIFCSLLRPELIEDEWVRDFARNRLAKRNVFEDKAMQLLSKAESEGGLGQEDAEPFLESIINTFRWHETAQVTLAEYERIAKANKLIADIVAFDSIHINHLTPRALDIGAAQQEMLKRGIQAKQQIEGPPARQCDILLRQTSFHALSEPIHFAGGSDGRHTARFGEIESRGAALTRKGKELYEQCLGAAGPMAAPGYGEALIKAFEGQFPDSWDELRKQELAFFRYRLASDAAKPSSSTALDELISNGVVEAEAITYEDFLPASAAGIFKSNLEDGTSEDEPKSAKEREEQEAAQARDQAAARAALEKAVGYELVDEFALYEAIQQESISKLEQSLGFSLEL